MVGTHMPRVTSMDRGRRANGCTWLRNGAGCVPTFSASSGSPQPSPVWNPDAEVGADYRIRPSPLERGAGHRFDFLLGGLCKLRNGPHSSGEGPKNAPRQPE